MPAFRGMVPFPLLRVIVLCLPAANQEFPWTRPQVLSGILHPLHLVWQPELSSQAMASSSILSGLDSLSGGLLSLSPTGCKSTGGSLATSTSGCTGVDWITSGILSSRVGCSFWAVTDSDSPGDALSPISFSQSGKPPSSWGESKDCEGSCLAFAAAALNLESHSASSSSVEAGVSCESGFEPGSNSPVTSCGAMDFSHSGISALARGSSDCCIFTSSGFLHLSA